MAHRDERHLWNLPASTDIKPVLLPADFRTALGEAGIEPPDENALTEACASVFFDTRKVISAAFDPPIGAIRGLAGALQHISDAYSTLNRILNVQLAESTPDEDVPEALAHTLCHSRAPVIIALRDAASGAGGEDAGSRQLAESLIAAGRLADWAQMAHEQFATGVEREKTSREDWAARSPARALGFTLIALYGRFTGRKTGFSRQNQPDPGTPAGPQIRYLRQLFECMRHNLAASGRTELARRREWNPSPETLVDWIELYRKEL